jgi:hypothetical protein
VNEGCFISDLERVGIPWSDESSRIPVINALCRKGYAVNTFASTCVGGGIMIDMAKGTNPLVQWIVDNMTQRHERASVNVTEFFEKDLYVYGIIERATSALIVCEYHDKVLDVFDLRWFIKQTKGEVHTGIWGGHANMPLFRVSRHAIENPRAFTKPVQELVDYVTHSFDLKPPPEDAKRVQEHLNHAIENGITRDKISMLQDLSHVTRLLLDEYDLTCLNGHRATSRINGRRDQSEIIRPAFMTVELFYDAVFDARKKKAELASTQEADRCERFIQTFMRTPTTCDLFANGDFECTYKHDNSIHITPDGVKKLNDMVLREIKAREMDYKIEVYMMSNVFGVRFIKTDSV